MSSTNKTSLGLNMWEASDKPVRQDFVNDNVIIDEKISKLNNNLSKLGVLNMDLFRVNFDSANNRIVLEFYKSATEIYYLKFGVATKEILLDVTINGVSSRPWTFN